MANLNGCVVQVTKKLPQKADVSKWNNFLKRKGFITEIKEFKHRERKKEKTSYILCRNLTEKEKKEILNEEYFLQDGFLMANERKRKERVYTESTCPKCKKIWNSLHKGERQLCSPCLSAALKGGYYHG